MRTGGSVGQADLAEMAEIAQSLSVAARRITWGEGCEELLSIARRTAALELTVASRAIDLHGGPPLGAGTRTARDIAREYATTDPEER